MKNVQSTEPATTIKSEPIQRRFFMPAPDTMFFEEAREAPIIHYNDFDWYP